MCWNVGMCTQSLESPILLFSSIRKQHSSSWTTPEIRKHDRQTWLLSDTLVRTMLAMNFRFGVFLSLIHRSCKIKVNLEKEARRKGDSLPKELSAVVPNWWIFIIKTFKMYLKRDPKRKALSQKGAQMSQGIFKTTYVEQDCKNQRKGDLHPWLWGASFEKDYRNDIQQSI